jgi:hypothetical protein
MNGLLVVRLKTVCYRGMVMMHLRSHRYFYGRHYEVSLYSFVCGCTNIQLALFSSFTVSKTKRCVLINTTFLVTPCQGPAVLAMRRAATTRALSTVHKCISHISSAWPSHSSLPPHGQQHELITPLHAYRQ